MESKCAPSATGAPRSSPRGREAVAHPPVGRHPAVGDQSGRGPKAGEDPRGRGGGQRPPQGPEAEAQAIERITTAIKGTGGDPARYLIAIRYIEALKEMVTSPQNNKVVYLPYEATAVLSSLGGIREMLAGPSAEKKG